MLGHDYGFKRIMSSYYFQDTDQVVDKTEMIKWITRTVISHDINIDTRVHQGELQPPIQISAGTVGLVSIGWFKCFSTVGLLRKGVYMYFIYFRWSSIMNMAQFANKVIGQPVTNWDVS